MLRRTWELCAATDQKNVLIHYNMDDCRAAATVTEALMGVCGGGPSELGSVDVGSLEVGFQRTFGKFDSATPEFAKINNAAYWDYQRSKVFVRTDNEIRRTVRKSQGRKKVEKVEKEVAVEDAPKTCSRCFEIKLWKYPRRSHIVYDLKFSKKGIKQWTVRYRYNYYRCSGCLAEMTFFSRASRYGPNLQAFVVYLLIELRISNNKAAEHASVLFDLQLTRGRVAYIKSQMAKKYTPTYQAILHQIAKGSLVHADETKGVVKGVAITSGCSQT